MSERINIIDLRDENCDLDVFHAETSTWNEARQKTTYGHDAAACTLCALLEVVENAHAHLNGQPNRLATALDRFDFDDAAHA